MQHATSESDPIEDPDELFKLLASPITNASLAERTQLCETLSKDFALVPELPAWDRGAYDLKMFLRLWQLPLAKFNIEQRASVNTRAQWPEGFALQANQFLDLLALDPQHLSADQRAFFCRTLQLSGASLTWLKAVLALPIEQLSHDLRPIIIDKFTASTTKRKPESLAVFFELYALPITHFSIEQRQQLFDNLSSPFIGLSWSSLASTKTGTITSEQAMALQLFSELSRGQLSGQQLDVCLDCLLTDKNFTAHTNYNYRIDVNTASVFIKALFLLAPENFGEKQRLKALKFLINLMTQPSDPVSFFRTNPAEGQGAFFPGVIQLCRLPADKFTRDMCERLALAIETTHPLPDSEHTQQMIQAFKARGCFVSPPEPRGRQLTVTQQQLQTKLLTFIKAQMQPSTSPSFFRNLIKHRQINRPQQRSILVLTAMKLIWRIDPSKEILGKDDAAWLSSTDRHHPITFNSEEQLALKANPFARLYNKDTSLFFEVECILNDSEPLAIKTDEDREEANELTSLLGKKHSHQ